MLMYQSKLDPRRFKNHILQVHNPYLLKLLAVGCFVLPLLNLQKAFGLVSPLHSHFTSLISISKTPVFNVLLLKAHNLISVILINTTYYPVQVQTIPSLVNSSNN